MESIESEGKTVAEAVEAALTKSGLRRDQVEVQILQEAAGGFLGLGSKPARVRITQKLWGEPAAEKPAGGKPLPQRKPILAPANPAEDKTARPAPVSRHAATPKPAPVRPAAKPAREPEAAPAAGVDPKAACAQAEETLKELARLMDLTALTMKASWDGEQERVKAVVEGADSERLIGPEGRTLEAVQFLATLIVGRRAGGPVAVLVDAQGFWDKKEQEILAQARRGIDEVKSTGKPVRLPPMEAPMRRLIHRSLANNPAVETASEGEGAWRKIVLRPRKG
jgi:spoIIIJ-associated protein